MPAGLRGSQTLLCQERFADEPGGVIGEDKRRLWIVDSDGLGGVQPAPRFLQPWCSVGASSPDSFEVTSSQELLDLLGAFVTSDSLQFPPGFARGTGTMGRVAISSTNLSCPVPRRAYRSVVMTVGLTGRPSRCWARSVAA